MLGVNPLLLLFGLSFHRLNLVFQFDDLLHHIEISFLLQLSLDSLEGLLITMTFFLNLWLWSWDSIWCLGRCFPFDFNFWYFKALFEFKIVCDLLVKHKTRVELNRRFRFRLISNTDLSFTIVGYRLWDFLLERIDLLNNCRMKLRSRGCSLVDWWSSIPSCMQLPWRTWKDFSYTLLYWDLLSLSFGQKSCQTKINLLLTFGLRVWQP